MIYKKSTDCWVRDEDYIMVLQQVGPEVFHRLVNFINLLVNGRVVEFWSLRACAHEGDWVYIVHLVLLSEYCS